MITGLSIPQEYVCISMEDFCNPLSVHLTVPGAELARDITHSHLLLGYKPLVLAVVFSSRDEAASRLSHSEFVCMNFNCSAFVANSRWRGIAVDRKSVARLFLKRNRIMQVEGATVVIYVGMEGIHSFIGRGHQTLNRIIEKMRQRKPGNVALPGNLYDMVRIAYSIPRVVSLITLAQGNEMNMFPTDLHGPLSEQFYISSLRIGGKANDQVERCRRIAIATVDSTYYRQVYAMGKNHMQDLRPMDSFQCGRGSHRNGIPLPMATNRYRELHLMESFDIGIHRIHLYATEYADDASKGDTLGHIHQYYAQWRVNKRLPTKMLFR